jgi:hypothetical protein
MKKRGEQSMAHPRSDLSFVCNRRTFFRALFQEAIIIRGSLKGGQGGRLSELGSLPDEQLARVRPILTPEYETFVDQGHVWGRNKTTKAVLKLFPAEQENLVAFNMFDGQHTLGEIGRRLAQEMGWDEAAAFAHARDLFLSLVGPMVCVPRDAPESDT